MNLASLRQAAEAATPGPWYGNFDGVRLEPNVFGQRNYSSYVCRVLATLGKNEPEHANANHIAAFNPQVALALIAVAEAAQEHADSLAEYPEQLVPINRDGGTARALRATLAVLEKMG